MIDPHGDLTVSVLRFLAKSFSLPDENEFGRKLVLVEPFNRECAIGFNPLEAEGQHFAVVLELMEVFHRFWQNGYWGPRMDELLRCTLMTLSVNNFTLLEARPLLTNAIFRGRLTENIPYNEVRDYWQHRYNQLSESMQSVFREPVLNRISAFITDPTVYRILGQKQSTLNFRQIMDEGKWVLVNMSKGYLKENMGLLGTIILTKIKQAALSRIDIPEEQRRPFYVYIDEFQNFVVEDMEGILSEARKFRLGMILSHQNLEQLPVSLRAAILGNAQTDIFFRLSHRDASLVSAELEQKEKRVIERHLIDLNVRQAYLKTKGQNRDFSKPTLFPPSRFQMMKSRE